MEILKIDAIQNCETLDVCAPDYLNRYYRETVEGHYSGIDRPGDIVVAYIDLHTTYDEFLGGLKKYCKGNVIRDARKADKLDYASRIFEHENFVPDFHEINYSKPIRCGRPMTSSYTRSVEEMGGAPTVWKELTPIKCPVHWLRLWGIFKPDPGYKQGDIVVDQKLLGYISLTRVGNYVQYAMILGHGDYLKDGIIYRLHFAVLEWLLSEAPEVRGLDFVWYCNWYGGPGLRLWKKKAGFKRGRLMGEWYACMV